MGMGLNKVPGYVWVIGLIGIFLGVIGIVLAEFVDQGVATLSAGENSTAVAMINDTLDAMTTISDWMPILIIVLIVSILLTLLVGGLGWGGRR